LSTLLRAGIFLQPTGSCTSVTDRTEKSRRGSIRGGVPPATVTTPLRLSVSVIVFPAFRSPVAGDSTIEVVSTIEVIVGFGATAAAMIAGN